MRAAAILAKSRQPVRSRPLIIEMDPEPGDDAFEADGLGTLSVEATYNGESMTIASLHAELLIPIMSAAEAERSEALLLPTFLTDAEMRIIRAAAEAMPFPAGARKEVQSDYSTGTGAHVALNLHKDGYFARGWPELLEKIRHGMLSQPGRWAEPGTALGVRCVEFHTYTEGGGLMMKDHRDYGSVLTLSVLLSHPSAKEVSAEVVSAEEKKRLRKAARSRKKELNRQAKKPSESEQGMPAVEAGRSYGREQGDGDSGEGSDGEGGKGGGGVVATPQVPPVASPEGFTGGDFFTWLDGAPRIHRMARGDALLFHSEKVHNVYPITQGVRHSLVIELWLKPDTCTDRYT